MQILVGTALPRANPESVRALSGVTTSTQSAYVLRHICHHVTDGFASGGPKFSYKLSSRQPWEVTRLCPTVQG